MELKFFKPTHRRIVRGKEIRYEVYPEFLVRPSDDLMTRGGKFYAIYDKSTGFWTQNEFKVQEFVDEELKKYAENDLIQKEGTNAKSENTVIKYMIGFHSKSWVDYKNFINYLPDNFHQLDDRICFSNTKVKKTDYISKQLPYPLEKGSYDNWDKLVGTLYAPEEREKIEWAIGAVISGDSKDIQKFIVLYGAPGAGKGTILKVIQKLFPGYYETFDAKTLGGTNAFAFEQFRSNPLIAIQTDGDLSKIEDNTKLNSLISHEQIVMNEKRKQSYTFEPRCFLFMASNNPVKITDSNSGLLRRLINVDPSGKKIPKKEYDQLMNQIDFERNGIAYHCLEVYQKLGKNRYNAYNPTEMMERTNPIYNFVLDKMEGLLAEPDGISLRDAYLMWEGYRDEAGLKYDISRPKFKEELKYYFHNYDEMKRVDKEVLRGWYSGGIIRERFSDGLRGQKIITHNEQSNGLVLDQKVSLLDEMLADCQAQYGEEKPEGGSKPEVAWSYCKTKLKDIDTTKLHFLRPPKNHIVIDFDLKNEKGEKDSRLNLDAAEKFPRTYAEFSQGGHGLHLHYIYNGDPSELASEYGEDIEIKVFTGKSSLRRRVSLCNNIPVATLSSGSLPKKEVNNDTVDFEVIQNELHLKNIIAKCLEKKIAQPHTAPAMSLIKKSLDTAYKSGISYDVRDLENAIKAFAAKSHHQKDFCMKMANDLHYCSQNFADTTPNTKVESSKKEQIDIKPILELELPKELKSTAKQIVVETVETKPIGRYADDSIVFFDIEVFPNLLLVNWKEAGEDKGIARMINPSQRDIINLMKRKLVGFNCRRYDNHILYARAQGYTIDRIYKLSSQIVGGKRNALLSGAYDVSYTDIYDFAAKKQSLKKWEIELGIHHQELGLPWDQPVDPKLWKDVAEYCDNDVIATEAVFNHLQGDFKARQILADIAGMKVNDTTNQLTTRIIFGDDPKPQVQFNYPDLAKEFPGYRFENGKSYYRHDIKLKHNSAEEIQALQDLYKERYVKWNGDAKTVTVDEEIGEGGRVFAVPGIHEHVITFDVTSMHPSSIIAENGFGKYTEGFKQLLDIRVAIKNKDFEKAKTMLGGKLAKYLDDKDQAKALSQALKIAINSVYGLTAAGFDNKFRDPRNKDNWVAKRGALFIETLRLKVTEMGGRVVHIKTDSIKVIDPSEKIRNFILDYGKKWGYNFTVEDIYEKMCLVNDAVYIALRDKQDPEWIDECAKAKKKAEETKTNYIEPTRWSATGAQFAHPYVFKTLFSHEPLEFRDLCETKSVTTALYLDFNENLSDVSSYEKDLEKLNKKFKDLIQKGIGLQMTASEFEKMFSNPDGGTVEYPAEKEPLYIQAFDLMKDKKVLEELISEGHKYQFVGKAGCFCPVKIGTGGGVLCREKDGKFSAATGSKGYRWRESESLKGADRMDLIDMAYFDNLANVAKESVGEYANKIEKTFEEFASEQAPLSVIKISAPEKPQGVALHTMTIDEMLEHSDKMFGSPPFDDESIARSKEALSSIA